MNQRRQAGHWAGPAVPAGKVKVARDAPGRLWGNAVLLVLVVVTGEPVGLKCPGCGEPPAWVFDSGRQCFCGTDGCPFVTWDSTLTLAELNADAGTIDLSGLED